MRSRTFLHVSLGILALAAAYHLGARSATAQAPGNSVVGVSSLGNGLSVFLVMTAAGDPYVTSDWGQTWTRYSNCFGGGPTPARQESMGAVKARYR
jgi:hypothetical protein